MIGHVQRNCQARADLQQALRVSFGRLRTLDASECVSEAIFAQRGNAGLQASQVLICSRSGEAPELEGLWSAGACVWGGEERQRGTPISPQKRPRVI